MVRSTEQIPRLLRWLNPYRAAKKEAADQALAKRSKVDTLSELTPVQQFRDIADDELTAVEKLRSIRIKDWPKATAGASGPTHKDTFVTDNMTIDNGGSRLPELLLVAFLGGAALLWMATRDKEPPAPPPTPAEPVEIEVKAKKEFKVLFYDGNLNPIVVPRLPPQ